jgi:cell division protein FtsI (penicillin-binding protein 3)
LPAASTLDERVQHAARAELDRTVAQWQPQAAFVVVIDPESGAILAMEGRENGHDEPTMASKRAYVTGSTFKAFVIAAALDERTIAADARVDCAPRAYVDGILGDSPQTICPGSFTVTEALTASSNIAASRILDTLGLASFASYLRKFHLSEPPASMPAVTDGNSFNAGLFAAGELMAATPQQVAAGYAALFNGGEYVAPTFARVEPRRERVLRHETASTVVRMLEDAVGDRGTGRLARVPGLRVAGKTGTADIDDGHGGKLTYASFVGTVLDREPRFVALVGLVGPREGGTGPSAAAPAFARLVATLVR